MELTVLNECANPSGADLASPRTWGCFFQDFAVSQAVYAFDSWYHIQYCALEYSSVSGCRSDPGDFNARVVYHLRSAADFFTLMNID